MTVNLGWRDGDDVFLVADSALTYPFGGVPRHPHSTVGEPQRHGLSRVEEAGAKLVPLSDHTIAAYAGDSQAAIQALASMRQALAQGVGLRDCLSTTATRFRDLPRFSLLVAGRVADASELWVVDPGHPTSVLREVYLDREPIILGSLPAPAEEFVRRILTTLYGLEPLARNPRRLLASTIMALQSLGQRVSLYEVGAGGSFFGAMLSHGEVVFQDDIVYALYRPEHIQQPPVAGVPPVLVFSGVRGGVLMTCSSLTDGHYHVFVTDAHPITDPELEALMTGMIASFGGRLPLVASHYGFIDRETGALAHVFSPSQRPQRYLAIESDQITLQPELLRTLANFPRPAGGVLPDEVPHVCMSDV